VHPPACPRHTHDNTHTTHTPPTRHKERGLYPRLGGQPTHRRGCCFSARVVDVVFVVCVLCSKRR
jgi:hypothetical protein